MSFYHDLVTVKSWKELCRLRTLLPFVLIGGWAVYLYTRALKSKDIDIVISFDGLSKLKDRYAVSKNDRLRKYEARVDEVEIDIYLPHYSRIGIAAEEIIRNTKVVDGFTVVAPDTLFLLKLYTLSQRGRSPKGRKDFIDLISLVTSKSFVWQNVRQGMATFKLESSRQPFIQMLNESQSVPELGLNRHGYGKMKKQIMKEFGKSPEKSS
jgi:hypothetical protein